MRAVWIGVAAGIVLLLGLAGWGIWSAGKNMAAFVREADARDRQAAAPWVNKHPAYADLDDAVTVVQMAANDFASLSKGSERTGKVRRQTDPAAAGLLDAAFDTRILDGPLPPMSKFGKVNDWLKADIKIGMIYTFAGTGLHDSDEAAALPPDQKQRADLIVGQNIMAFAPEYGRYLDAQMRIVRVEIAMIAREADQPPGRGGLNPQGIDQLRNADAALVDWFVSLADVSSINVYWRRARMTGLLAMAPDVARLFTEQQKASLRDKALAEADHIYDRELKAGLTSFANQMSGAGAAAPANVARP